MARQGDGNVGDRELGRRLWIAAIAGESVALLSHLARTLGMLLLLAALPLLVVAGAVTMALIAYGVMIGLVLRWLARTIWGFRP